ncbi:hypothetical protein, partial [Protofrankia coriariae]|uniref:hypothetical protein n=1 Tax=Protofrankia coriariae TaxID=1562887 RepID=UPI001F2FE3BC
MPPDRVLQRPAAEQPQHMAPRPLPLQVGERVDEQQGVLLPVDTADGEQFDRSRPVTPWHGRGDVPGGDQADRHRQDRRP